MTDDSSSGVLKPTHERWCRLLNLEPVGDLPVERAVQIPGWCCEELIAGHAEPKFRGWALTTPRETWGQVPDQATLLRAIHCAGDVTLYQIAAELLAELPPPVRDYAVKAVMFAGVGMRQLAWCGPRIDCGDRPWLVLLSACAACDTRDSIRARIAEELAHAWLSAEPAPHMVAGGSLWHSALLGLELQHVPAELVESVTAARRHSDDDEHLAAALLKRWGFEKTVRQNYSASVWAT